jgi:hypothetical protein
LASLETHSSTDLNTVVRQKASRRCRNPLG